MITVARIPSPVEGNTLLLQIKLIWFIAKITRRIPHINKRFLNNPFVFSLLSKEVEFGKEYSYSHKA
jgi:hypothetical protein